MSGVGLNTFDVVLERHLELPAGERPAFVFRVPSLGEARAWRKVYGDLLEIRRRTEQRRVGYAEAWSRFEAEQKAYDAAIATDPNAEVKLPTAPRYDSGGEEADEVASDELLDELEQQMVKLLVGWRHQVDLRTGEAAGYPPPEGGGVQHVIDEVGFGELIRVLPLRWGLSALEKKGSGSASTANSASAVKGDAEPPKG